jgi:hypothetical protein
MYVFVIYDKDFVTRFMYACMFRYVYMYVSVCVYAHTHIRGGGGLIYSVFRFLFFFVESVW